LTALSFCCASLVLLPSFITAVRFFLALLMGLVLRTSPLFSTHPRSLVTSSGSLSSLVCCSRWSGLHHQSGDWRHFLVHISHGFDVGKGGFECAFAQLLIAFSVLLTGSGAYSLAGILPPPLPKL